MKKIAVLTNLISLRNGSFDDGVFLSLLSGASVNLDVKVIVFEKLKFIFSSKGARVIDSESGLDLSEFDRIYIKRTSQTPHYGIACAVYAKHKNIDFIDSEFTQSSANVSSHKLVEHMIYAVSGLPFPDTKILSWYNYFFMKSYFNDADFPVIMKSLTGTRGTDNFLVNSIEDMEKKLRDLESTDFAVQPFIPNDCDYRFLTLGYKTALVIKRTRTDEASHTNNTSKGARATLIPLEEVPTEMIQLANRSARIFKREIAGVDIMVNSESQEAFILEVNRSPQIESGAFVSEKIAALAEYLSK